MGATHPGFSIQRYRLPDGIGSGLESVDFCSGEPVVHFLTGGRVDWSNLAAYEQRDGDYECDHRPARERRPFGRINIRNDRCFRCLHGHRYGLVVRFDRGCARERHVGGWGWCGLGHAGDERSVVKGRGIHFLLRPGGAAKQKRCAQS